MEEVLVQLLKISQVNFKSGSEGLITKEGDQAYIYINGNKVSQNYISVTADDAFKDNFDIPSATTLKYNRNCT